MTKPKLSSRHLPIGEGDGLAKAEIQISFLSATSTAAEWKWGGGGRHPKARQPAALQLKPLRTFPGESTARNLRTDLFLFPFY